MDDPTDSSIGTVVSASDYRTRHCLLEELQ